MKTKVEVRAKALDLALECYKANSSGVRIIDIIEGAKHLEEYIVGSANIPECEDSIESQIGGIVEQVRKLYDAAGLGGCNATPIDDGEIEKIEKMVIANNRKYEKD